ncbi:uncharacterized protein LOC130131688 isoform X2 [Lampris incognitus]|uniref:uncharacterized protein LOC130131688 isoform X2 n=1 Tax=Lampris incognitus TaxID=2546036 RepID=UPI0024B4A371|nr:uncharacterized protein LOC130131688 isoform X2 [Lampris incognitus]
MWKARAECANCSVVGCKNQHKSLYGLPSSEDRKSRWIHFIFDGNVPTMFGEVLYVCANHFTADCFVDQGQCNAEFTSELELKDGSAPTVRDPTSDPEAASTSLQLPATRDVGCQTDPPQRHTVGTQLSLRTLQPHIKSEDHLLLLVFEEKVPSEQQEWSPSLDQERPAPPHIKEEEEELWSSQEGEQFQGLNEEADVTKLPFTPVPVKIENDEEKGQRPHTLKRKRRNSGAVKRESSFKD